METLSPDAAFQYQKDDPGQKLIRTRDPLVVVIAVLHLLRACWFLYVENRPLFYYLDYASQDDPDLTLYGPPFPMIALGNLTAIVILAAGIGLLARMKWGWWLAEFTYAYGFVGAVYLIGFIGVRHDELQQMGVDYDAGRYYFGFIIYLLLFAYLQTNKVLRSFDLMPSNRFRIMSIAILLAAAVATYAATLMFSSFIYSTYGTSVPYITPASPWSVGGSPKSVIIGN
jgi:hypothetical protein